MITTRSYVNTCLLLLCFLTLCSAASARPWIREADYDDVHMVVPNGADGRVKQAADAFARYWERVTSCPVTRSSTPTDGINVWIGAEGLPDRLAEVTDIHNLGPDGICVKTVNKNGKHLILAGPDDYGTLFSVYEFIEDYLGVRWLTPDVTHIPEHAPDTIPRISVHYTPPIRYRRTSYARRFANSEFVRAHKLHNADWGMWVHTAYYLVPPAKFGADHPEYFSLVDGKRLVPDYDWQDRELRKKEENEVGQIDFANPEVAKIITHELKERFAQKPNAQFWSVSQQDWRSFDESDRSRAIDAAEGSHSGHLLVGVNRVAKAIENEYPDHFITTLAYQWSRQAPKSIRPRDNVAVRLCSIECDFSRPLADPASPVNQQFYKDIQDWTAIAPHLLIWDYTPNFHHALRPHPNFHVIQPNLELFAKSNALCVFEQGWSPYTGGGFAQLRTYLIAKCLWDPEADWKADFNEFIDLYYGPAAPYIKQYIDMITEVVLDPNVFMSTFDPGYWMDGGLVERSDALFQKAFEATRGNAAYTDRVDEAYLTIQYAAIFAPPTVEIVDNDYILRRPPSLTLAQFFDRLRARGIRETGEHIRIEDLAEEFDGKRPSRFEKHTIEKIENEHVRLWVVPDFAGAVVRFQHIDSGTDFLAGFRRYGTGPGLWQEWSYAPMSAEEPIADTYEVVGRNADSLTLRATLEDGLVLTRVMRLDDDAAAVEIELTLTNPTDTPVTPKLKIHPEFDIAKREMPTVLVETPGGWTPLADKAEDALIGFAFADASKSTRWAVRIPGNKVTLINEFDPESLDALFYFANIYPGANHVNLELCADTTPLRPGQSRTLRTRYSVVKKLPKT